MASVMSVGTTPARMPRATAAALRPIWRGGVSVAAMVERSSGDFGLPGVAGDAHGFDEGASGVDNFLRPVIAQCGDVDEVGANSEGEGSGSDVFGGVGQIHAAGGDETRLRERSAERLNVFGAADAAAGENFDESSAGFERGDHFGGSEGAGDGEFLARRSDLQNG